MSVGSQDYPHSAKAKKHFLVIYVPWTGNGHWDWDDLLTAWNVRS